MKKLTVCDRTREIELDFISNIKSSIINKDYYSAYFYAIRTSKELEKHLSLDDISYLNKEISSYDT